MRMTKQSFYCEPLSGCRREKLDSTVAGVDAGIRYGQMNQWRMQDYNCSVFDTVNGAMIVDTLPTMSYMHLIDNDQFSGISGMVDDSLEADQVIESLYLDDLSDHNGLQLTSIPDPLLFQNSSRGESTTQYVPPHPSYPTFSQKYLHSQSHYPSNGHLMPNLQRAPTGSLPSLHSIGDSGLGDSLSDSPCTPQSAPPCSSLDRFGLVLQQFADKSSDDPLPLHKYSGCLPESEAPPEHITHCAAASIPISPDNSNVQSKSNTLSYESDTDRIIRLSQEKCKQQAAHQEMATFRCLTPPREETCTKPKVEKAEKDSCSNAEPVGDSKPPEEQEPAVKPLVRVNRAGNGYRLRHRDKERKWSIEDDGSDLESNSTESEASSEEDLEDEGSDSDHQYQPNLGRNSLRGQGYVNTGSRVQTAHSPQLWEFLLMVLDDTSKKSVMGWKDKAEGIFKIYNSASAARLWGRHKNKGNMNYDKMSRAMRYYYSKGIFEKVPGRLVYKFSQQARQKYANNKASFLYNRSIPKCSS